MLNSENIRELAFVAEIDAIEPIEGSDNCECAVVGGWRVMVRKGEFKRRDVAVYFEVDSKLDSTNPAFAFMANKKYKVLPQRYTFGGKGNFISQGLLMSAQSLGWTAFYDDFYGETYIIDEENKSHSVRDESRFLTKKLKVTYATAEDNIRKAPAADMSSIKNVLNRYPKIAKRFGKIIVKNKILSKLFMFFFAKRASKRDAWPTHIAEKTDCERAQNMPYILQDKTPFVASEKVDGSSFTAAAERTKFGKIKYYVCSRNVSFKNEEQTSYYDTNIWYEMYNKYNLKTILTSILKDLRLKNVAIQAEIYGEGVQKRDYSTADHKMAVFHIVTNREKFPMDKVVEICNKYGLPHVPIIDWNYILPDTMEELQEYVESAPSLIDGKEKEGIVFYDKKTGQKYFKFVSPNFLLHFH